MINTCLKCGHSHHYQMYKDEIAPRHRDTGEISSRHRRCVYDLNNSKIPRYDRHTASVPGLKEILSRKNVYEKGNFKSA